MTGDYDDPMNGGGGGGGGGRAAPPPATEIIKPLAVSLEDFYNGATKKLMVTKKRRSGESEANTLEIVIKPGYKVGTKIKFKGAGSETAAGGTQDMTFVLEAKPHALYTREGNDLLTTVKIPLVDALSGPTPPATFTRTITTLDGRVVRYDIPYPSIKSGGSPIKPGLEIKVKGEGMPISKTGGKEKGDLKIKIEVEFPDHVSASVATQLRQLLGDAST